MFRTIASVCLLALVALGVGRGIASARIIDPSLVDPRLSGYPEVVIRIEDEAIAPARFADALVAHRGEAELRVLEEADPRVLIRDNFLRAIAGGLVDQDRLVAVVRAGAVNEHDARMRPLAGGQGERGGQGPIA